jgi:hypothetical protein
MRIELLLLQRLLVIAAEHLLPFLGPLSRLSRLNIVLVNGELFRPWGKALGPRVLSLGPLE